jgi:pimeloyl-ACP methyl ester carboxylesterase
MSAHAIRTGTHQVDGATIHYEVRGDGPPLVLHAAPMTADALAQLADLMASEHTVVTSDPRGIGSSSVDDPACDVTPDQRADDLARLLDHLDVGPCVLFGSSGGAVSALALASSRPDLASMVIAHEPPLAALLADRDEIRAATDRMIDTYLSGDRLGYWRQFMALAAIPMPDDVVEHVFGGPMDERATADERYAVVHMDRPTTFWQPDLDALRALGDRVVVGIGDDSTGQLCDRTSRELAARLDLQPTLFPGDHIGFAIHADAFAASLRTLLHERP